MSSPPLHRFTSNYLTTRLAREKRYRRVRDPFSVVLTRQCPVLAGLSAEEEKKAKKRAKKAQQKQEEQKKGTGINHLLVLIIQILLQ